MVVHEGQILGKFVSVNYFQLQFHADEWDVVRLEVGDTLNVQFYAFPNLQVHAEITDVARSPMPDNNATTYIITAKLPIPPEMADKWRFGMRAQISIENIHVNTDHPL